MVVGNVIREPARDIAVYGTCDVLVVGGGPAGCAAAASAASIGANTILVERYGHLGGMSTGGLVIYFHVMTDWTGRQVIAGFANEIIGRLPKDAILGAPKDIWGSKDPQLVQYWQEHLSAWHGIVTWSPKVDPERLKLAYNELLLERKVKLLLHAWAVAPVLEQDVIRGVIFESKSGRQAILAKVVIDTTGDGDIFALAGAPFEGDIESGNIHSTMNMSFRMGGVDYERYIQFSREHREEFEAIMARGAENGIRERPVSVARNDVALFMGPRLFGYSCINVEDLTAVEIESRRLMPKLLDFYRSNVPGFENAWIMDTSSQMGTRHSRRLVGVKRVIRSEWLEGKVHDDEIAVSPGPNPAYPNVSIPLGALTPITLDGLLAAGRSFACDAPSHTFLRPIPQCWAMGQAAGVAAALAVSSGVRVRDVDVTHVQRQLLEQNVYLQRQIAVVETPRTESPY